jgi:D-glycero-alpha-D-manno-heptose-7-phosphate kinase
LQFFPNGEISVQPVVMNPQRKTLLCDHLLLFYTGIKRTASTIADGFVHDMESRRRHLRILKDLVKEGLGILTGDKDLAQFGELLHEAWLAKRSLSAAVSNEHVDDIYSRARAAGAIGGKLLGAGGGGFILFFAPPDVHERVKQALSGLFYVPCRFEQAGSQIVFYDPENDYAKEDGIRASIHVEPFRELTEGSS